MNRTFDLTESEKSIRGMFWLPGDEENQFGGLLHLEAGNSARLETSVFNFGGLGNFFPSRPKRKPGEKMELVGEEFEKAMFRPSKKVINGHDEHGDPITLIRCSSGSAYSTLAMACQQFNCEAAIFGVHLPPDDLMFDGIRLHLDHLDDWVGRSAYRRFSETFEDADGRLQLDKIVIPIARTLSIPLGLSGYSKSEFYCSWGMREDDSELSLWSRVFLDLFFDVPRDWEELIQEIHQWQWFIGLAARSPVEPRQIAVYRSDVRYQHGEMPMRECPAWMCHHRVTDALREKRREDEFHFRFGDVEADICDVIERWHRIQKPWAAVLHRFFATAGRKGLWLNEEFLFLAQAIESLHRARTGDNDTKGIVERAAKQAYLNAPQGLQETLGDRGLFVRQFRKTRNYWTHYGDPSPSNDSEVLTGTPLHGFCHNLRCIVESAILQEIGVPDRCVPNVWSRRWMSRVVEYE